MMRSMRVAVLLVVRQISCDRRQLHDPNAGATSGSDALTQPLTAQSTTFAMTRRPSKSRPMLKAGKKKVELSGLSSKSVGLLRVVKFRRHRPSADAPPTTSMSEGIGSRMGGYAFTPHTSHRKRPHEDMREAVGVVLGQRAAVSPRTVAAEALLCGRQVVDDRGNCQVEVSLPCAARSTRLRLASRRPGPSARRLSQFTCAQSHDGDLARLSRHRPADRCVYKRFLKSRSELTV